MKTGFKDLDNIINLNEPQLIVCTSADYVIHPFLSNVLKNISVEQKISTLYIDELLMSDCSEAIKKEREILFNNQIYEIDLLPELIESTDNTLNDIVACLTMINKFKIFDNRIVENILSESEVENLKIDNKINLVSIPDIADGNEFTYECELFNNEEKERVMKADEFLKNSPMYIKHVTKICLSSFKKMCHEYKNNHNVNIIIVEDINTIVNDINTTCSSDEITILKELQELSKTLNIPIIIGYSLIRDDEFSIENELENIKQKCKYIDTILFLKIFMLEYPNIWHIKVVKNKNNKLGSIRLGYLDEYNKCCNNEDAFRKFNSTDNE